MLDDRVQNSGLRACRGKDLNHFEFFLGKKTNNEFVKLLWNWIYFHRFKASLSMALDQFLKFSENFWKREWERESFSFKLQNWIKKKFKLIIFCCYYFWHCDHKWKPSPKIPSLQRLSTFSPNHHHRKWWKWKELSAWGICSIYWIKVWMVISWCRKTYKRTEREEKKVNETTTQSKKSEKHKATRPRR